MAVTVQPMSKAAYCSDFYEKHRNRLQRGSMLGPDALQESVLLLQQCSLPLKKSSIMEELTQLDYSKWVEVQCTLIKHYK